MSQLVLDDQLDDLELLPRLRKWITAQRLRHLRPNEHILDERIPEILLTFKQPTFITIDQDFWHRGWCNPNYCILYFALRDDEQKLLPGLLRALLRLPEFHTRAQRLGKVARVGKAGIEYWQFHKHDLQHLDWKRTLLERD